MTIEKEIRGSVKGFEARASDDKKTLVGYASVFNEEADIGPYFREVIAPGAFAKTLKSADVRALVDHNPGRVIGRSKSGTLRLEEDERGLRVEIDVPDTGEGRDLWTLVERGDIDAMSFGFIATVQEWDHNKDPALRTVKEVELFEVSAVAWPAYEGTEIGVRSLAEHRAAVAAQVAEQEPALPASRAAPNLRARLSKGLDLKVRTTR